MGSDQHIPQIEISTGAAIKDFAILVGLLAVLVSTGCGGGSTSTNNNGSGQGPVAASISGTIKVGTAPSAIAVDSANNKVVVTDFGVPETMLGTRSQCQPTGADVIVIDGATETTISERVETNQNGSKRKIWEVVNESSRTNNSLN